MDTKIAWGLVVPERALGERRIPDRFAVEQHALGSAGFK